MNKRYLKLKYYVKEYTPQMEKKVERLKELDFKWKTSKGFWDEKEKIYKLSVEYEKKKADEWKRAFLELKEKKAPKESWTRHPALWVAVGVVGTVIIVYGSVALLNKIQPVATK